MVVVGVDGSATRDAAVGFAMEAAAARNVGVVAVHSWWEPVLDPAMAVMIFDWDAIQAEETRLLAQRMAGLLMNAGRIVWRELSLRSRVNGVGLPLSAASSADSAADSSTMAQAVTDALWPPVEADDVVAPELVDSTVKAVWRIARPDVFSVRNTTVEDYLQPAVHEIKVSRADLLSDLRHAAKRESYQWLCSECYFVFPAGIAEPDEIPEAFGVWVLHGAVDDGRLELLRPARHSHCKLPFSVWLALAKSTPERSDDDGAQGHLGVEIDGPPTGQ